MKIRQGFVSNSSSTSFIITNLTNKNLKLKDFVEENPKVVEEFRKEFDWHTEEDGYTQKNMLDCAINRNTNIKPGDNKMSFGDEDGDILGCVFDYSLRYGGGSKRFKWKFHEMLR